MNKYLLSLIISGSVFLCSHAAEANPVNTVFHKNKDVQFSPELTGQLGPRETTRAYFFNDVDGIKKQVTVKKRPDKDDTEKNHYCGMKGSETLSPKQAEEYFENRHKYDPVFSGNQ